MFFEAKCYKGRQLLKYPTSSHFIPALCCAKCSAMLKPLSYPLFFFWYTTYCKDSITIALAPPPPLQIPAQPTFPFLSLNTPNNVVVILAPDAPRG